MRWIKWLLVLLSLGGTSPAFAQFGSNATKLRGFPICGSISPTSNQGLSWDGTNNCWKAGGPPALTLSGSTTQATPTITCFDRTFTTAADLTAASASISVTIGTAPAHWLWDSVWARETVTFAGTGMTTATVSIGPSGSETAILPTVGLKQSTNTTTGFAPGYSPGDSATAIVAQFIITSGGGTWNNASAGTYDIRVCGHAGR